MLSLQKNFLKEEKNKADFLQWHRGPVRLINNFYDRAPCDLWKALRWHCSIAAMGGGFSSFFITIQTNCAQQRHRGEIKGQLSRSEGERDLFGYMASCFIDSIDT